jgi:hypothetical protein
VKCEWIELNWRTGIAHLFILAKEGEGRKCSLSIAAAMANQSFSGSKIYLAPNRWDQVQQLVLAFGYWDPFKLMGTRRLNLKTESIEWKHLLLVISSGQPVGNIKRLWNFFGFKHLR